MVDKNKITIDKKTYPSNAAAALSLGISYSAFMSRKYRGKNRNEIKLKGTIPRKSRSKIQILNDTIVYMILFIIIGVIILAYYFYTQKQHIEPMIQQFIPSNSFIGEKKGYVFKNCSKGLGYYIDSKFQ